jgi:hypothetical protein
MLRESSKAQKNRGGGFASVDQFFLHLQHDSGVFLYVALLLLDGRKGHNFYELPQHDIQALAIRGQLVASSTFQLDNND